MFLVPQTVSLSSVYSSVAVGSSEPLIMQHYMSYGYHSVSLLLHQHEVQIAAISSSTDYTYKLPRYPFSERGCRGMSVLLNKEAVVQEPPALKNPYIGRTPGTIDHEESESMKKRTGQQRGRITKENRKR